MRRVPLEPKIEYEKSRSSIGSTWAAQTHNKFIFNFILLQNGERNNGYTI